MAERQIVRWVNGQPERWQPTTLDKLNKDEKFFEGVLVTCPELIGLESRRSGIYGPFKIFTQLGLHTPTGRPITLDIVVLAASGHVIVVEVKRYANQELRDRAVIAQIIDYASSFASLTDEELVTLFGSAAQVHQTWGEIVQQHFPDEDSCDDLAKDFRTRIRNGELNLVIACDRIPPGLPDVVAGIAAQRALGFDLDLVEVVPYVREVSDTAEIMFVPSTRLATEIIARTAVTVTYCQGNVQPSTSVEMNPLEEIAEGIRNAGRGRSPDAQLWSPEAVEEQVRGGDKPSAVRLLEFVKRHSADGKHIAEGLKVSPRFGFYVRGTDPAGSTAMLMIFAYNVARGYVRVNFNSAEELAGSELMNLLREKLKAMFGNDFDATRPNPSVSLDSYAKRADQFEHTMLWFKQEVERGATER